MKCKKCHIKNIDNANYCKKCGNKFSEKEKQENKKGTIVWFLEWLDKIKALWKFSFITDNILFKIVSVLLVLAIGVFSILKNGNNLKILESDNYQIQYNTKLSEYYLLVNDDQTELKLYIPNTSTKLTVEHLDKDNKILEKKKYDDNTQIILETNTTQEDYYLIKSKCGKKSETLKIYIYGEGNVE